MPGNAGWPALWADGSYYKVILLYTIQIPPHSPHPHTLSEERYISNIKKKCGY